MKYGLFEVFGIESEYMIVDKDMNVAPLCDFIIKEISGEIQNDTVWGKTGISNELAMHVVEFKTDGPTQKLDQYQEGLLASLKHVNEILAAKGARLLPGAMHPWMDPSRELVLWKYGQNEIYEAYHRIFNCTGHGWSNLQSVHLNLPFADESEFVRLHEAIRILLGFIPALTASSAVYESNVNQTLCNRMHFYAQNQKKIPQISGLVIPERIDSIRDYHQKIFQPMYEAIKPYDVDDILQEEWLNSRGAIARFDRDAIEIRVIDIQEAPAADFACLQLIIAVLKDLVSMDLPSFREIETEQLHQILKVGVDQSLSGTFSYPQIMQKLGMKPAKVSFSDFWFALLERPSVQNHLSSEVKALLGIILTHGSLSQRIVKALKGDVRRESLRELWEQGLLPAFNNNKLFVP